MFRILLGALGLIPVFIFLMITFFLCIVLPFIGFPLALILVVVGVKAFRKGWNDGKQKATETSSQN